MTWMQDQIVQALTGTWLFERVLEGAVCGTPIATVKGRATFVAVGMTDAAYAENGVLALDTGQSVSASGHYYFRQLGGDLAIFFDEGRTRLFHRLNLRGSAEAGFAAASTHFCAPDRYESLYEFRRDGSFAVEHVVSGPRKSYISRTLYRRA
jgi:hypothetical protein